MASGTRATRPATPGRAGSALEVRFPPGRDEEVALLLWEAGTTGTEERAPGCWRAWFAGPPPAGLRRRLAAIGRVRGIAVDDVDWVRRSRARSRAVRVGPLLVRAPWSRARPRPDGLDIVIDPARAFGTGSHESTRLVLAELVREPPRGKLVLDVGTGSGILALAALALGARAAIGLDVDPEATRAARANAAANRRAGGLWPVQGGPGAVGGRFPLVLANLTAPLLGELAGELAARVAPSGALVAAGFLERDLPGLAEAFGAAGLAPVRSTGESEWSALRLTRRAAAR